MCEGEKQISLVICVCAFVVVFANNQFHLEVFFLFFCFSGIFQGINWCIFQKDSDSTLSSSHNRRRTSTSGMIFITFSSVSL